jgi:apolipoprotein N-acyltransferase
MSKQTNHNKVTNPLKQYARYTGIAFQMMAVMAISAWVGYKLDQWLSIEFPVFTLGFTVVAIGLVLYKLVKSLS